MRSRMLLLVLLLFVTFMTGCGLPRTVTPGTVGSLSSSSTAEKDLTLETNPPSLEVSPSPDSVLNTLAAPTQPAPTETPAPSPTPAPVLRRLTSGGCCVDPFWSPDGERVLYIDRPSEEAPSGIWSVDLQGGEPVFVTDRLGIYSPDMALRATLVNGVTLVERLASGEQWRIPNDGRAVSFSPDGQQLAWTAGQSGPPFDSARREVWVSRFDGSQARQVFSTIGGGFVGWFPDGRLLVSGRIEGAQGAQGEQAYWALNPDQEEGQSQLVELGHGGRLREARISMGGSWLAYMVTFSPDSSEDGLWLVDTYSGDRRRLDVFGGYQWRDDGHLLVVPLELDQPAQRLLQVDAATGEVLALTDPALTSFKIADGDWSVSPDGTKIVFNSAQGGDIWVLEIPGNR